MRLTSPFLVVCLCLFPCVPPVLAHGEPAIRFRSLARGTDPVDAKATCRFVERVRRPASRGRTFIGGHVSCGEANVRSVLLLATSVPRIPMAGKATQRDQVQGKTGAAVGTEAETFTLEEVAPSRLRATVAHMGNRGGGRWFAMTSGVVAGPGDDEVLASGDDGRSWVRRGHLPKGERGWQVLLLQFHVDRKGDGTAATLHELDGKGQVVVCQRTSDGRTWRLLDVFPFVRPEERRVGLTSEDFSVRAAATRVCPGSPPLPLTEEETIETLTTPPASPLPGVPTAVPTMTSTGPSSGRPVPHVPAPFVPETFSARKVWRVGP